MSVQTTKPKSFCFVLMPFATEFGDVYEFGIKGACEEVGVYCERVDEQEFDGSMLDRIYNQISRADLLVADMTAKNPNVFYEVGYAHALGKTVILLTKKAEDIPFDLKHFPHIVYGSAIKDLRSKLAKRIQHFTSEAPPTTERKVGIELYVDQRALSDETVTHLYEEDALPNATITIYNASTLTYAPGDCKLCVIAPPPFFEQGRSDVVVTQLPNGSYSHMLPNLPILFPNSFGSVEFYLGGAGVHALPSIDLTLRALTAAGHRDFPLRLKSVNSLESELVNA